MTEIEIECEQCAETTILDEDVLRAGQFVECTQCSSEFIVEMTPIDHSSEQMIIQVAGTDTYQCPDCGGNVRDGPRRGAGGQIIECPDCESQFVFGSVSFLERVNNDG